MTTIKQRDTGKPKQESKSPEVRRQKKLWEVDSNLHCSIIGTCFSFKALRKIARKVRLRIPKNATDYQIHGIFVSAAKEQGPAAKEMQKLLRKKYACFLTRFRRAKDAHALADLWEVARRSGDIAGPYWAVMSHPDLTPELQNRVFGEVHMLSHIAGASVGSDLKELEELRRKRETLALENADMRARVLKASEEREYHMAQLRSEKADSRRMRAELDKARDRIQALEAVPLRSEVQRLRAELKVESSQHMRRVAEGDRLRDKIDVLRRRMISLERERAERHLEQKALEEQLERILDCGSNCPDYDATECPRLCGHRVLYVGGRTGSVKHFRALVERGGGKLLHHDGGIEDSGNRLKGCIAKADAVLIPTTCVSHEASLRVKRTCKRQNKPLVFLQSSGLSAFVAGLSRLSLPTTAEISLAGQEASTV